MPQARKQCSQCNGDFAITNYYSHRRICTTASSHGGNVVDIRTNPVTGTTTRVWKPSANRRAYMRGSLATIVTDTASWVLECISHRDLGGWNNLPPNTMSFAKEVETREEARRLMKTPWEWCIDCHESSDLEREVFRNDRKVYRSDMDGGSGLRQTGSLESRAFLFRAVANDAATVLGLSNEPEDCDCERCDDEDCFDCNCDCQPHCSSRNPTPFQAATTARTLSRVVKSVATGYYSQRWQGETVLLPTPVFVRGLAGLYTLLEVRVLKRYRGMGASADWTIACMVQKGDGPVLAMPVSRMMAPTPRGQLLSKRPPRASALQPTRANLLALQVREPASTIQASTIQAIAQGVRSYLSTFWHPGSVGSATRSVLGISVPRPENDYRTDVLAYLGTDNEGLYAVPYAMQVRGHDWVEVNLLPDSMMAEIDTAMTNDEAVDFVGGRATVMACLAENRHLMETLLGVGHGYMLGDCAEWTSEWSPVGATTLAQPSFPRPQHYHTRVLARRSGFDASSLYRTGATETPRSFIGSMSEAELLIAMSVAGCAPATPTPQTHEELVEQTIGQLITSGGVGAVAEAVRDAVETMDVL